MRAASFLIAALVVGPMAACTDPDGNPLTLQQWFQSRGGRQTGVPPPPRRIADGDEAGPASFAEQSQRPNSTAPPLAKPADDPPSPPSRAVVTSDALAIDEEIIRVVDVLEPIQRRLERLSRQSPPDAYYREASRLVRQQIIEAVAQHLVWRRAKRQITDEIEPHLKKAVDKMEKERINREFDGRETLYYKYLAKHGKTREAVRERLRRSVVIESYLREQLIPRVRTPSKREIQRYYNDHLTEYSSLERREMYLIDIPVSAFLDFSRPVTRSEEEAAVRRARQSCEAALAELKSGASFDAVCRKYSHGAHKDEGGAWGFIAAAPGQAAPLRDRWAAPSRQLFALGSGETSEIIESARSFFIVRVGRIEPGRGLSFQDAQPRIIEALKQERFVKLRADFLRRELAQSTLGPLDEFVERVMHQLPASAALSRAADQARPH